MVDLIVLTVYGKLPPTGTNAWVGFYAAVTFILLFVLLPVISKLDQKEEDNILYSVLAVVVILTLITSSVCWAFCPSNNKCISHKPCKLQLKNQIKLVQRKCRKPQKSETHEYHVRKL